MKNEVDNEGANWMVKDLQERSKTTMKMVYVRMIGQGQIQYEKSDELCTKIQKKKARVTVSTQVPTNDLLLKYSLTFPAMI